MKPNRTPAPQEIDEALTRLLLGEVDETERADLEATLARDPEARRGYEERREAIELLRSVAEAPRLSDARRAGIFAAVETPSIAAATITPAQVGSTIGTPATGTPNSPTHRNPGWFDYSGIAAAFLVFAVTFCFLPETEEPSAGPVAQIIDDRSAAPPTDASGPLETSQEIETLREQSFGVAPHTLAAGSSPPDFTELQGFAHSISEPGPTPVPVGALPEVVGALEGAASTTLGPDAAAAVNVYGLFTPNDSLLPHSNPEGLKAASMRTGGTDTVVDNTPFNSTPFNSTGDPSQPPGTTTEIEGFDRFKFSDPTGTTNAFIDLPQNVLLAHHYFDSVARDKEQAIRFWEVLEKSAIPYEQAFNIPGLSGASIAGAPGPGGKPDVTLGGIPASKDPTILQLARELTPADSRARAVARRQQLEETLGNVSTSLAAPGLSDQDLELTAAMGVNVRALTVSPAPQIDGVVVAVRDGIVVLSVGRDDHVKKGTEFTIYTGDQFIAKVKVENVLDNMSGARVLFTEQGKSIAAGAKASTRLGGGGSTAEPTPLNPLIARAMKLDPTGFDAYSQFPQISGDLLTLQAGYVVIGAGAVDGVSAGSAFDVVEQDRVVGRLRVVLANDDVSACEITTLEAGIQLSPVLDFRAVPNAPAAGFAEKLKLVQAEEERKVEQARRHAAEERVQAILRELERRPNETPADMYFRYWGDNPFVRADLDPLSTFGIDVDTASHSIVRNYLRSGLLPPRAAVRTEEFVNAYPSELIAPTEEDLAVHLELATSEFSHRDGVALLKVGVKAREVSNEDRKPIALTFVIDVSGSMKEGNRLETVKQAILTLLPELDGRDTIGIVAFSTNGRVVLEPVSALDVDAIGAALLALAADGSTNAQEGLDLGYAMAERQFRAAASNRVALFSDGVANAGITDLDTLLARTSEARGRGIEFSSFGVGMGNHNDTLLEQLADRGNGVCAYLDTLKEAQKLFRSHLAGTFQTVARDAKIQVEFHPEAVASYRQIGYENRAIADADFRNDAVDAGEVGAGHEVIALYEVELRPNAAILDSTGTLDFTGTLDSTGPIATVRVRYHSVDRDEVVEMEKSATGAMLTEFFAASDHFRLSAVVAAFAEILRDSSWARRTTLAEIEEVARSLTHLDRSDAQAGETDRVAELLTMVAEAKQLIAKRVLSDLDRILDEVKRNRHLRARLEDRLEEPGKRSVGVSAPTPLDLESELEQLRAQHDQLERRLRTLVGG